MKRKLTLILVILMTLTLILTGCGGNPLQKVVKEAQAEIPALEKQFGGMMEIAIEARGENTLVYVYKYTMDIGDISAAKGALESAMSVQTAVFDGLVQDLKKAGVKDAAIVVEYVNVDGTMIYSAEFK